MLLKLKENIMHLNINTKIRNLMYLLFNTLTYLFPHKKNYYVFYPTHERNSFTGNLAALFEYGNNNIRSTKFLWLTRSEIVYKKLKKKGYDSKLLKKKFSHFRYLLRAQYIFIDGIIAPFNKGAYNFVQAWHGTGFKDIGVTNPNKDPNQKDKLTKHFKRYQFVSASSSCDKERKEICFHSKNVFITGSPRNDIFFNEAATSDIKIKVMTDIGINPGTKIITYAPTYRDNNCDDFPINESTLRKLSDMCELSNTVFLVKNHPASKSRPLHTSNHVIDITNRSFNTQYILISTDILITDYSGIVTDFVLCNRPYIFYHNDRVKYEKNCRSFYYNLDEVLPGPIVETEADLLNKIFNVNWFYTESHQIAHKRFQNMFHEHLDGFSSKRFYKMLTEK